MTKYLILFLLAGSILFTCSCNGDDGEIIEEVMSPFAGIWSGETTHGATGNLTGTLIITVRSDGSFSAEGNPPHIGAGSYMISGSVAENGFLEGGPTTVSLGVGESGVLYIFGNLDLQSMSANGNWSINDASTGEVDDQGTWKVEKDN